jgi:hypothetical protein
VRRRGPITSEIHLPDKGVNQDLRLGGAMLGGAMLAGPQCCKTVAEMRGALFSQQFVTISQCGSDLRGVSMRDC